MFGRGVSVLTRPRVCAPTDSHIVWCAKVVPSGPASCTLLAPACSNRSLPTVLFAVFLWRNMGGALLTLLPAVTSSLKARAETPGWLGAVRHTRADRQQDRPRWALSCFACKWQGISRLAAWALSSEQTSNCGSPAALRTLLQEKSDAGQLSDRTARTLNLGLLLSSLGHLAVLGPMANEGTGGK